MTDCERLGSTNYYWYHQNLQISDEMTASSGLLWHLCLVLLFAWVIVFAVMMKGLAAAGKVRIGGCCCGRGCAPFLPCTNPLKNIPSLKNMQHHMKIYIDPLLKKLCTPSGKICTAPRLKNIYPSEHHVLPMNISPWIHFWTSDNYPFSYCLRLCLIFIVHAYV